MLQSVCGLVALARPLLAVNMFLITCLHILFLVTLTHAIICTRPSRTRVYFLASKIIKEEESFNIELPDMYNIINDYPQPFYL